MNSREWAAIFATGLLLACLPATEPTDSVGTWVGSIVTDGQVTTVINESGSVLGRPARLVEEASIGVETGAVEYMFGEIGWVHSDGELVYVVDRQAPAVRVYDTDGRHVRDIGSPGQGPGEYTGPRLVTTTPDGRVWVVDRSNQRISVYGADGTPLDESYPIGTGFSCCNVGLFVDAGGTPWLPYRELAERGQGGGPFASSIKALGPSSLSGEVRKIPDIDFEPANGTSRFSPRVVWNTSQAGALLVGASDRYRFEIHAPDGATTVVEKNWDRVAVQPEEAAYFDHLTRLRPRRGAVAFVPVPDHKPAFLWLSATSSGEAWVLRQGPGIRSRGCDERPATIEDAVAEEPCWQDSLSLDVFDNAGRYTGSVDVPAEMHYPLLAYSVPPHFERDAVIGVAIDEVGTLRVKRYRLEVADG